MFNIMSGTAVVLTEWYKGKNVHIERDPLSMVAKLASVVFYEYDTKLYLTQDGGIAFQERGYYSLPGLRGVSRRLCYSADREQLKIFGRCLTSAALIYLPHKNEKVRYIFSIARKAILCFHRTYYDPQKPESFQHFIEWVKFIDKACAGPIENAKADNGSTSGKNIAWNEKQIEEIHTIFVNAEESFVVDFEWQKDFEAELQKHSTDYPTDAKKLDNPYVKPIPARNIYSGDRNPAQKTQLYNLEQYIDARILSN